MATESKNIRELCCQKLKISEDVYDQKVLLACLPRWYHLLGWVRWHTNPAYFETDVQIVQAVAECRTLEEAMKAYRERQEVTGFQRGTLRFRITRNRLERFIRKILQLPPPPKKKSAKPSAENLPPA